MDLQHTKKQSSLKLLFVTIGMLFGISYLQASTLDLKTLGWSPTGALSQSYQVIY